MKALTAVASSCTRVTLPCWRFTARTHKHLQNGFLFVYFSQYWQLNAKKTDKKSALFELEHWYCAFCFLHPFCISTLLLKHVHFCLLLSRDWPWPVSVSLASLILTCSWRQYRKKWLKSVFRIQLRKTPVYRIYIFFIVLTSWSWTSIYTCELKLLGVILNTCHLWRSSGFTTAPTLKVVSKGRAVPL